MDSTARTGNNTGGANYVHAGAALPPGYVLNHAGRSYRIVKTLGSGGFGITYEALCLQNGARVAIKEMFPRNVVTRTQDYSVRVVRDQDTYSSMLGSFLKEIRILRELRNVESVVEIYDDFYANNTAYYVMEYVGGDTLFDYIRKTGKHMVPAEWEKQFGMLMQDIALLHRNGVIHRDISPDNIKVTEDRRLRLIDFGSARSYDSGGSMTVALKEGFAPIEQYSSKGQGSYTDVYTLAATMYYCFTGRLIPQALKRKVKDTLEAPTALGAALTPQQEKAMLKALAIEPEARFQTMEEFAAAYFPTRPVTTPGGDGPGPTGQIIRGQEAAARGGSEPVRRLKESLRRAGENPLLVGTSAALFLFAVLAQLLL